MIISCHLLYYIQKCKNKIVFTVILIYNQICNACIFEKCKRVCLNTLQLFKLVEKLFGRELYYESKYL